MLVGAGDRGVHRHLPVQLPESGSLGQQHREHPPPNHPRRITPNNIEDTPQLGAPRPSESAIWAAFARVDSDVVGVVVGAFCGIRTGVVGGCRVIALDGETVRGARTPDCSGIEPDYRV